MIKTFVQRAISCLPRSDWWNGQFQRYVTKGLHLDPNGEFRGKLRACQKHYAFFRCWRGSSAPEFSAVELGTGWFPILPLGLYLCGAVKIWSYDIAPLVAMQTLKDTLRCFLLVHEAGMLRDFLPEMRTERIDCLRRAFTSPSVTPRDTLAPLGIHLVVGDIRKARQPDESVDLVFSNGVLEHLPRHQLVEVLTLLRRWIRPTGVMIHHVGMADQFASFDRSITPFNFLQYSRKSWRWLDNPIIPQNRLRHSDYLKVLDDAVCEVLHEEKIRGRPEDLRRQRISREFEAYDVDDLLVLESWIVARGRDVRPRFLERKRVYEVVREGDDPA
jgi:predicted SAM-dependent methyltransferase